MNDTEQIKNTGRRRLAKGVLAGPAVLASITSKNALGGTYACAVSGQQSGNISRGTPLANANCVSGFTSRDGWRTECGKSTNAKATQAPLEFGVEYKKNSYTAKVPATNYQIFTNAAGLSYGRGGDNELLQAALTVYLNAGKYGSDYHVDQPMCLRVFDAAANQGTLNTGHKVTWNAATCRTYLMTLAGM